MGTVNLFGALSLEATQALVKTAIDYLASAVSERGTTSYTTALGIPALTVRHDSDSAGVLDNEYSMLHTEEEGRLKVSTKPGSFAPVVGVANTIGSTVIADVSRASNVVFHLKNVGSVTMSAGTFVFEASLDSTTGSDGTWFSVQAVRTNANTIETGATPGAILAGAGNTNGWEASVNGYKWFRIRNSVIVTASASAQWTILRGSYATEPIPAAQASATQPVSGTVATTPATGTTYNVVTTASTNAAVVKTAAGNVFELSAYNTTATTAYIKLYGKASAPTVGTDVPFVTIPVPGNDLTTIQFGALGKRTLLGIAIAVTAAAPVTDTAATVAGVQIGITYA